MQEPSPVRATDTLANERTYLAYVRTAIAFIAFGFVVARFSLFVREIGPIAHLSVPHAGAVSSLFGSATSIFGIIVGIVGGYRYASTDRALREGRVLALSPILAYVGTVVLAAVGVLVALSISGPH
jgi:putative membrane protein